MCGSSLRVSVHAVLGRLRQAEVWPGDSRRAVFHVGNNLYSSKLVDLPCVIETQKTLDNKQMFKVADICQVTQHIVRKGLSLRRKCADACRREPN